MSDELTFNITVNVLEAGMLMGFVDYKWEQGDRHMASVRRQLVAIFNQVEQKSGVVKEVLSDGQLKVTNDAGEVIIRPPRSWEVEQN